MGLIKCPDCGRDVSDAAPSCPNCGRPTRVQTPAPGQVAPSKKKTSPLAWGCLVVLLGVLGLFVLAALLVDHSATDRARSPEVGGAPAAPQLELKNFGWHTEYGYAILEGQVTNISAVPLKNVTAVASFYDAKGGFVTSSEALIEYNPILPGQTSPFSVGTTENPAMKKAAVDFKDLLGGTIPFRKAAREGGKKK
ncbi:MAG: FxLYD domain-containing protein [Terriglobia bacterium]|jgi:hypothetical protein